MSPNSARVPSFLRRFGSVLAATLLLGVPVYAACTLAAPVAGPAVTVAPEDDAVRDLRIVKEPRHSDAPPAASGGQDAPAVLMLENWVNTDHSRPSPHG
jgi:hypothetical protein